MTKQLVEVYGYNLKVDDTFFDINKRVFKVIKEIDSETLKKKNQEWIQMIITFKDGTMIDTIYDGSKVMILLDIEEIIGRSNL